MNPGVWAGFLGGGLLMAWGISMSGAAGALLNAHGLLIVIGGTLAAALINCPIRLLWSSVARLWAMFLPSRLPLPDEAIGELVRLARKAQAGGGLLSLRDESREFAEGFLHRSITVAIATGESSETRRILEKEIKQLRISRQEDANVYRTVGLLSPMFGILGTLLGMIKVLGTLSDPTKIGPAMALALSSAFMGIGIANFFCVPVAGQIRLAAMRETLVLEILLEGLLDIAAGKPPYLVELHLSSYSQERRRELESAEAAPVRQAAGPVG